MVKMRKIKFRAWSKKVHAMIDNATLLRECDRLTFVVAPLEQWIIMQSTGLKDENGVEIFEGDIVRFTYWWFDGNECESTLTGTMVYADDFMSFQLKGVKNKEWERFTGYEKDKDYLTPFSELNFDEADFEVIGNIYETPNLLKENK